MTRRKQIDDPYRMVVTFEKNTIDDLEVLSKRTGIRRSKLIRLGSDLLVILLKESELNKEEHESYIDRFMTISDHFKVKVEYNEVDMLIDNVFLKNKILSIRECVDGFKDIPELRNMSQWICGLYDGPVGNKYGWNSILNDVLNNLKKKNIKNNI